MKSKSGRGTTAILMLLFAVALGYTAYCTWCWAELGSWPPDTLTMSIYGSIITEIICLLTRKISKDKSQGVASAAPSSYSTGLETSDEDRAGELAERENQS